MFKLASWNVNSLTVRLNQVLAWLDSTQVDVLALQETKISDDKFPYEAFQQCGYHVAYSGQKTYNGVAFISRHPINAVMTEIPGWVDPARRFLAATIAGIRVINLYVPNGAAVESDKYQYKLSWMSSVARVIEQQLAEHSSVAVVGDFNIAPDDRDVHDPVAWEGGVLVSPLERDAFQALLALGLNDSFRNTEQAEGLFSWWDYRAAAFRRNRGLRIDLILLNQALNARCAASSIDAEPRRSDRPSDHAPVWVELFLDEA